MATKASMFVFEGHQLLQTIEMGDAREIQHMIKLPKGVLVLGNDHTVRVWVEDTDEVTLLGGGAVKLTLNG